MICLFLIVFFVVRWRNFQAISRSVARHLLFFQPTHGRGALLPKKIKIEYNVSFMDVAHAEKVTNRKRSTEKEVCFQICEWRVTFSLYREVLGLFFF